MNDSERSLIRFVCDGDMRNAQKAVKIILNSISSKKDEQFKENMFRKLESKRKFIELPYNLQHLLIAEDTEEFPEARFLLRNEEKSITQKIVAIYRASEKLNEMGIPYLPALMLYGQSGCGKTMLARYIAHKAKALLPFFQFIQPMHKGVVLLNRHILLCRCSSLLCLLCLHLPPCFRAIKLLHIGFAGVRVEPLAVDHTAAQIWAVGRSAVQV